MWDSGTGVLYNQSGGIVPLRGMPYLPKLNFGQNNVSFESPTALSNRRIKLSLRYSLFLRMVSIVSMIMCTNGVQDSLKKIPMLCKGMFYRIIPKNIPGNFTGISYGIARESDWWHSESEPIREPMRGITHTHTAVRAWNQIQYNHLNQPSMNVPAGGWCATSMAEHFARV